MRNLFFILGVLVVVLTLSYFVGAIEPFGATVTNVSSERANSSAAGQAQAQAGNVTELNLFGYSVTQTWQGYFGNVTGVIALEDSSGDVLYNWSLATPSGEVYASRNNSITWTNIQCLNYSATGDYTSEIGNGGTTSLYGTNISLLENEYNIDNNDVDGVDETFSFFGAGTHDLFYAANQQFSEGECRSTRVYGDTGQGESNEFEEVLLYEPSTSSVVFAALLESDVLGFDGRTHDFEMLVLEDGHGSDTSSVPYYFYVELE